MGLMTFWVEKMTASKLPLLRNPSPPSSPAPASPAPAMVQNNPELFAELKKLRLHLAKERSVPAFVISSDKTLNQMANDMPITENDFPAINGVGNSKLEKFYQPFQAVIAKF